MVWGAGDEENTINKILAKNPNYLLAYNEPDMSWNNGGSNISVDTAINNWDIFKKYKSNYKLGAPAPALSPSWDGGTWFRSFMDRVDTDSIDFIPLHCQMPLTASCNTNLHSLYPVSNDHPSDYLRKVLF